MRKFKFFVAVAFIMATNTIRKKIALFVLFAAPRSLHCAISFPDNWDGRHLKCKEIDDKMKNSSYCQGVVFKPTLTAFESAITAAEAGILKAKTGLVGSASAKNVLIRKEMNIALKYESQVDAICELNPGDEIDVAASCGMHIVPRPGFKGYVYSVRATGVDGQIEVLGVPRRDKGPKPIHNVQITTDPSQPANWLLRLIPVQKKAKFIIDNCPINTLISIRYRWVVNGVEQAWYQVLTIKLLH